MPVGMGIFSKNPDRAAERQTKLDQRARDLSEKMRAKAAKKGVNVDGALAVGHTIEDSGEQFLVVFPDRIDLVNRGKMGSLLRSGAGTESIPTSRISSVECANKGISAVLEVHTSGNHLEFKADVLTGPYLRDVILEQMNAPTPTAAAGVDVTEQLRQLAELHQAGILTDHEFATKKTELLDRI